ncbi:MAG: cytochrome-c peroxidase [Granulosicoccus sp.]
MTCAQRTFIDIAKKLLDKKPLQYQKVHPNDSRLRNLRDPSGTGLVGTYRDLIQKAFRRPYWNDSGARYSVSAEGISADADGVTQMEHNFLLFWGLSMQAYQAILVSDRAPVDKGLANLKPAAQRGFELFTGKGNCSACHTGPLFADSTTTTLEPTNLVNNVQISDESVALMDRGFHNIGVTPTSEDLGLGGPASGVPFSHTVQWVDLTRNGKNPNDPEVALINRATFDEPLSLNNNFRTAIDGAFKTTTLRNVGLTPPYFHDGSYATLKQVVQFYNRGGNVRGTIGNDSSGSARAPSNLSFNIKPLGLTNREVNDLVAFLRSLTDYRVACHRGVFDHPELPLTRGHQNAGSTELAFGELAANDYWSILPAVGRGGLKAIGKPCFPNTGRLFGKAQTVLNEITDFEPYYEVPADKPDSRIGFEPEPTPPPTPPENEWLYCASTERTALSNRQCYFPEIRTLEARFVSDRHETAYRTWGPMVWCLPHMFGVPFYTDGRPTQGVCEYRPLELR